LSSKVIGKGRTKALRRHDLALWLCLYFQSVYIYISSSSVAEKKGGAFRRRSRKRSTRIYVQRAQFPRMGREGEAPERRRSPRAWVERLSPRAWVERLSPPAWVKPPSVGRKAEPPSVGRKAEPPSVGRKAEPPSVGEAPERGSKG
jgi:hypothetical protein